MKNTNQYHRYLLFCFYLLYTGLGVKYPIKFAASTTIQGPILKQLPNTKNNMFLYLKYLLLLI